MTNIRDILDKYKTSKRDVSVPVLLVNKYGDKDEAFFSYNRESKKVKEWYKLNFENGELVFYSKIHSSDFYLEHIDKKEIAFIKIDHEAVLNSYLKIREKLYTDKITKEELEKFVETVYKFMDRDLLDSYLSLGNDMFKWIEEKMKECEGGGN